MSQPLDLSNLDRRNRRTDHVPRALAFQCATVQSALNLESVVISDDVGDFVGAGDKALCRLLSRSAPVLSAGDPAAAAYQFKALQAIREDLQPGHLTTYTIRVPQRDRLLFVVGVGTDARRSDGVVRAAGGSKRILGYTPATRKQSAYSFAADPQITLQRAVIASYQNYRVAELRGMEHAPSRHVLGLFVDDSVYADALRGLMKPVYEILNRSGLQADDIWTRYRFRSREVADTLGNYRRIFTVPLREPTTGVRLGTMQVGFIHRHDVYDIPCCPVIQVTWR